MLAIVARKAQTHRHPERTALVGVGIAQPDHAPLLFEREGVVPDFNSFACAKLSEIFAQWRKSRKWVDRFHPPSSLWKRWPRVVSPGNSSLKSLEPGNENNAQFGYPRGSRILSRASSKVGLSPKA
jgi:hypothetical protein